MGGGWGLVGMGSVCCWVWGFIRNDGNVFKLDKGSVCRVS